MSSRALIGVVVAVALVVGVGGVLYAFGTPESPAPSVARGPSPAGSTLSGPAAGVSGVDNAGEAQDSADKPEPVVEGAVPAPDPGSPLAVEIPGCVCHSDDPELVAEHSKYRMNQCAGCHLGEVPTGQ